MRFDYNILPIVTISESEKKRYLIENDLVLEMPADALISDSSFQGYDVNLNKARKVLRQFEKEGDDFISEHIHSIHPFCFGKISRISPKRFPKAFIEQINLEQLLGANPNRTLYKYSVEQLEYLKERFSSELDNEFCYEAAYKKVREEEDENTCYNIGLMKVNGITCRDLLDEALKKSQYMEFKKLAKIKGEANIKFDINNEIYTETNSIPMSAIRHYLNCTFNTMTSILKHYDMPKKKNINLNIENTTKKTVYLDRSDFLKYINTIFSRQIKVYDNSYFEDNLGDFKEFPMIYSEEEIADILDISVNEVRAKIVYCRERGELKFFKITPVAKIYRYLIEDVKRILDLEKES